MKKSFFIVSLMLPIFQITSIPFIPMQQPSHVQQQKQQKLPIITDKTVNLFYDAQFQKEFKNVVKEFTHFKNSVENFKKHLLTFSKQAIDFQKNYDNFEQLFVPFEKIKQKPLTISITKLLQYKSAANKANLTSANKLISDLVLLLSDIDITLDAFVNNPQLTSNFFHKSSKVASEPSIADVFKDTIHTKFPFKIKKIKRSVINWRNV